jgi:hypothetical protein
MTAEFYKPYKISYPYAARHTLTHRELFLDGKFCVNDNNQTVAWFSNEQHAQLFCAVNNAKKMDVQIEALAYQLWFKIIGVLSGSVMLSTQPNKKSPSYEYELKYYEEFQKNLRIHKGQWQDMPDHQKQGFIIMAKSILNGVIGLPREKLMQKEIKDESHN